MAREIINDLANIIREHQKSLPNIEKLDVKDKFREVYKETEAVSYTHLTLPTIVSV